MVANILIASAFFTLGFLIGGAFVLRKTFKEINKVKSKVQREMQSDPLIIRVYGVKE